MEGDGVAHPHNHRDSVQVGFARGVVLEDKRPVGADKLGCGTSDGGSNVNDFDFFGLDYNREKGRFGAIGCAENGGHGQDLVHLIISELQLGAPAGLSGPVGDELLLVHRWRR